MFFTLHIVYVNFKLRSQDLKRPKISKNPKMYMFLVISLLITQCKTKIPRSKPTGAYNCQVQGAASTSSGASSMGASGVHVSAKQTDAKGTCCGDRRWMKIKCPRDPHSMSMQLNHAQVSATCMPMQWKGHKKAITSHPFTSYKTSWSHL